MEMKLEKVERFKVVGIRIIDEMENLNTRIQQAGKELRERIHEIRGVKNPDVLYGISPPNYKGNPGPLDFYVCIEVDPFENLPHGMVNITIDPQLYAVCDCSHSMNEKGNAYDFTSSWMKENQYDYLDAAYYFEVYDLSGGTNLEDLNDINNRMKVYSPVQKRKSQTEGCSMNQKLIKGVSDVFLPVRDLERAIEWYTAMLGFKLVFKDKENQAAGLNTGNGIGLCLVKTKKFQPLVFPENDFLTEITFNFRTDNLGKLYNKLAENGVEATEIYDSLDSTFRCFTFKDSDGNNLNVVCGD